MMVDHVPPLLLALSSFLRASALPTLFGYFVQN